MAPRTKPPVKKSAKKKATHRKKVVKKPVATGKVARVRKATGAHSVASPVAPGIPITPNENDYNRMPGLPYCIDHRDSHTDCAVALAGKQASKDTVETRIEEDEFTGGLVEVHHRIPNGHKEAQLSTLLPPGLPYIVKDDGQYQGVKMWEKVSLLDTPRPPWYRKFWNWLKKNW